MEHGDMSRITSEGLDVRRPSDLMARIFGWPARAARHDPCPPRAVLGRSAAGAAIGQLQPGTEAIDGMTVEIVRIEPNPFRSEG